MNGRMLLWKSNRQPPDTHQTGVDVEFSMVKTSRVTTASWKVGNDVTVKAPPPDTCEFVARSCFSAAQAKQKTKSRS
jgi:hypothetical protein